MSLLLVEFAGTERKEPPNPKKPPIKEPKRPKKPIGDPPPKKPPKRVALQERNTVLIQKGLGKHEEWPILCR